jgi:hypothetical protein
MYTKRQVLLSIALTEASFLEASVIVILKLFFNTNINTMVYTTMSNLI